MKKLDINEQKMVDICRAYGTGKEGVKAVAKEFHLTDKQAENQIFARKIKRRLQEEASAKVQEAVTEEKVTNQEQSAINSHEEHPEAEPAETEEYPDIKGVAKEVSEALDKAAGESVEKCSLNAAKEIDEMMELTTETINHPAHYNAGSIEVIDYLQDNLPP
jgi:plasmid replication initiation protein